MAPNIVFAPNMTQNAERKHRTQDTNTADFRSFFSESCPIFSPHFVMQSNAFFGFSEPKQTSDCSQECKDT